MPCGADTQHGSSAHRYASLYFLACVDEEDNELVGLETIHHFVEYPIPAPYMHLALPAQLRAAASVAPPMHTPRLLRVRVRVRVKVVSGEG
eukprot:scaffold9142_cov65-Phaeocystis_antarctica.AAC.1